MLSEKHKQSDVVEDVCQGYYSLWGNLIEMRAAKLKDPRLQLDYPLASRRMLASEVHTFGNTTETYIAVECVGRNGVRRRVDGLLRWTAIDEAAERILTIHTQIFASRYVAVPAFRFVQTFIADEIKRGAEAGCRHGNLFTTIVDETGVYRCPVVHVKTFL